jgi:hypothetical protein
MDQIKFKSLILIYCPKILNQFNLIIKKIQMYEPYIKY